MSITTAPQLTACPPWCEAEHEKSWQRVHVASTGHLGTSSVHVVDPGDIPPYVTLSSYSRDGEDATLRMPADEARALAKILEKVESDNAATLADALRKAADLIATPAAGS